MFPQFLILNGTMYYVSDIPPKVGSTVILPYENGRIGTVVEKLGDGMYKVRTDIMEIDMNRSTIRVLHEVEDEDGGGYEW